jgi:hypothetical protein
MKTPAMKTRRERPAPSKLNGKNASLLAGLLAVLIVTPVELTEAGRRSWWRPRPPCELVARGAYQAETTQAWADYQLAVAKSHNLLEALDRWEAQHEAWEDLRSAYEEAGEVLEARLDLCEALEEFRYCPEIEPDDFLSAEEIADDPNPYFPLVPGTTRVYEADTEDGFEVIRVHVSHETKEILGVTCIEVVDTVWVDNEIVEDTRDWFAQDVDGNVWYFGEIAVNFEDGEISDLDGSWEAGEDGAKPGIIMKAEPEVGCVYREEFLLSEAEDAAEILALGESVTVPAGDFGDCVKIKAFTPLEPDFECKFYAPGVGVVLEVKPESGLRVELVDTLIEEDSE